MLSRRLFLKMLGFGAASTLVSPPSVFGSDEVPNTEPLVWTPDQAVAKHQVVYKLPYFTPLDQPIPTKSGIGTIVGRFNGSSLTTRIDLDAPPVDRVLHVQLDPDIDDVHTAFYKAAIELRAQIAETTLNHVGHVNWCDKTLFTVVSSPITLVERRNGVRFAHADYSIQLVPSDEAANVLSRGYTVYSETGEYPIEVPKTVDYLQMIALDSRYRT